MEIFCNILDVRDKIHMYIFMFSVCNKYKYLWRIGISLQIFITFYLKVRTSLDQISNNVEFVRFSVRRTLLF